MRSEGSFWRYGPTVLALAAGFTFSLVTFFVFSKLENTARENAFENRAANAISAIRARVEANLEIVQSVVSFYGSSKDVTRKEFHAFTTPFLAGYAGIQALEWIPRVRAEERAVYEARARGEGYADFRIMEADAQGRIVPAVERAEYFPVFYAEPSDRNEKALGFDLGSEAVRAQVLKAARDSGVMQASPPITLVQDRLRNAGLLVLAPVYRPGGGSYRDEVEQRRETLAGFAAGVFRMQDLLEAAVSKLSRDMGPLSGVDLYIYDERGSADRHLVEFRSATDPYGSTPPLAEREVLSGPHLTQTLHVAGRRWRVVAMPAPAGRHTPWVPAASLLVGLAFTTSLAAYLLANARRGRAVEQLADVRSEELTALRDELRSSIDEHQATKTALDELGKIAKYFSPQVYASISSGGRGVEIASQRKKLTVLFCDIVGFTDTVERLASEDVTQVLNQYLTEMSRIGLAHGATIDKYVGDGIMMFFGDPESRGVQEDALACVLAAIAMQTRVRELQGEWETLGVPTPLRCRIGISTGYCMVGNFGSEDRMEYTIVGSGVNLASRLEAVAEPGSILVSHETYVLVRGEVCCEEQPPVQMKGLSQPVASYRVVDLWENRHNGAGLIREEMPSVKLELDLRRMSNGQRAEAAAMLQRVLSRLTAVDTD